MNTFDFHLNSTNEYWYKAKKVGDLFVVISWSELSDRRKLPARFDLWTEKHHLINVDTIYSDFSDQDILDIAAYFKAFLHKDYVCRIHTTREDYPYYQVYNMTSWLAKVKEYDS